MPEPAGDVSRLIFSHWHVGAGHGAEERGAHLRGQLLPAVPLAAEPDRLGDPRPGEAGGVPGPVGQLVEEGRVVGLRRSEQVRCRHGDPVAGRVVGRLARADPGPVAGDEVLAGGDRPDLARLLDLDALAL